MIQYIVQPGDSLYFIALKFRTSVNSIMKANHINDPDAVYPGQTLLIPNTCPLWQAPEELPREELPRLDPHHPLPENEQAARKAWQRSNIPYHCQVVEPGLMLTLTIQHRTYHPGQSIFIKLFKLNLSTQAIALNYSSSQRYDFVIQDMLGRSLWQWSMDKLFAQVFSIERIPAGETKVYQEYFEIPEHFSQGSYQLIGWNTSKQTVDDKLHLDFEVYM